MATRKQEKRSIRGAMSDVEKTFVAAYAGNATEAAVAAGYSPEGAKDAGAHLMAKPYIQAAIRANGAKPIQAIRATAKRRERQEFWTKVLRGETTTHVVLKDGTIVEAPAPMQTRLKAAELLARSEGDFLDRIEHSADDKFAAVLKAARERLAKR